MSPIFIRKPNLRDYIRPQGATCILVNHELLKSNVICLSVTRLQLPKSCISLIVQLKSPKRSRATALFFIFPVRLWTSLEKCQSGSVNSATTGMIYLSHFMAHTNSCSWIPVVGVAISFTLIMFMGSIRTPLDNTVLPRLYTLFITNMQFSGCSFD